MKHHGVNITTSPPPSLPLMDWMVVYSPGQERYLKQAKGAAQQEAYLNWRDVKHQERNITTPPPPPPPN